MNRSNLTAQTLLGSESAPLYGAQLIEDAIVHHGHLDRLAAMTSIPELRSAISVMDAWKGEPKTARAWSAVGATTPFELFVAQGQLRPLYDAGCTIVLETVETWVPALRPLCRALEIDLGVDPDSVNVEVFCSRSGGHGRPHFDPSFTFNCQIDGTKEWRIAKHEALRFPPRGAGMFLGRPTPPEFEHLGEIDLPTSIENAETFVAEPGTVVFLPPGVIHETRVERQSYAIAFAIDVTATLSERLSKVVYETLDQHDVLRAARLGGQTSSLGAESRIVVAELRKLADRLEIGAELWPSKTAPRLRLREGLTAEATSDTRILLRSTNTERALELEPALVMLLAWASRRSSFETREVMSALPAIDPTLVDGCIRQLIHAGLMEKTR